jgi:hypothetical protein
VSAFLYFVAGVVIGGLFTWLTSRYYYKRAGADLEGTAASIHKALGAIAYLAEHPNANTEVQRDSDGHVTGILVRLTGSATLGPLTASGTLSASNPAAASSTPGPISGGGAIAAVTEKTQTAE